MDALEFAHDVAKKIEFAATDDLDSTIEQLGDFYCSINDTLQKVDPFEASNSSFERMNIERLHYDLNLFFTELAANTGVHREVMGSRGFTSKVCSFLSSPKHYHLRFKYLPKVNELTSRITSLASIHELCKNLAINPSGRHHDLRTPSEDTSSLPVSDVFIGRDTDKENIINLLDMYSIVAIVGVGGQGKTTLAHHVCLDDRVRGSFNKVLWVSLNPKSSMIEILEKIIASAIGVKPNNCGLQELQQQVLQTLVGKRFLLVLDNVSYVANLGDDLEKLNVILKLGGFWSNGGKTLITTRSKAAAKLMDTLKLYELSDLAEDDCWILLRSYAIKQEDKKESGVEEIGKEIAKMCPKVPLVLKIIGRHLASMDYKSQWECFRNELVSSPTAYMLKDGNMKQALKLCYDRLDNNLKRCAAYCSLFPKGHVYDKNYMVRNWIALGFVEPIQGMSLEDVGDSYVLELTQRGFFEEARNFELFTMHDVIHDLMLLIGKEKHLIIDSKTEDIVAGARHISLNMQDLNWEERLGSGIDKLIPACQKLKGLDIYEQQNKKVPKSIGKLKLEKHLNFSGNLFCELPNDITKMNSLLALDLSWYTNLQEFPREIGSLKNLSALELRFWKETKQSSMIHMPELAKLKMLRIRQFDKPISMPKGNVKLKELETLGMLGNACVEHLAASQKLKEIEEVPKSIGKRTLVRHLNLSGNLLFELPNEMTKMVNLLTLDLSWCVNLQELPNTMGKLVNLRSLNLEGCWKLKELPKDMVKLVKLRYLWVEGCDLLTCMPEGFGNLRELEKLDVFVVGESSIKVGAKLEELGHLKNLKGSLCIKVAGESKYIVPEAGNAYVKIEAKLQRLDIVFEQKSEEDEKFLEGIQLRGENWKALCIKNYGGKRLPVWMTDDGFHKRFPNHYCFDLGRTKVMTNCILPNYHKDGSTIFGVEVIDPRESKVALPSSTVRDIETEIDSDLDKHSTTLELVEISQDLETELYTSVEDHISTADHVSGPSDICVCQEAVEAAEQIQLSHNIENEIQMSKSSPSEYLSGQTSVKADVKPTSSAEMYNYNQNVAVDRSSFQAEISETDKVLSLLKVDMKKPIQHTLEKILEAFKDAHRRRICLFGRGGSGKSTVLKNLLHHPETKELFHQVHFVTVPKFAYKKHVQDEIVKQLSLNIEESCTEDEVSCLIHQALINNKFLLLLDNVREPINLHEIGIPSPSPENSCWLVLATRCLDVSHLMADKEIEMEVLSNTEAWEVFSYQVGNVINSPEIECYARAVCKECYGSPVIISAIGSALRAESSVEEWEHALKYLQSGDTIRITDQCFFEWHIKYCYDRLKARDVKTYFLYIALFQEDREIDIYTLVECLISDGLVSGTATALYNKGHDIVGHLTNASLLEATDNGLKVKMHNVVKDSALYILSSNVEGYLSFVRSPSSRNNEYQSFQESSCTLTSQLAHKYLSRAGAHLKESPSVQEWEQATMIFLMDNDLSSLPNKPNCSNLVALLLQRNYCLREIPVSFFDSMSTLKILNLSKTGIKTLPDSICRLSSLQILLLRDCKRFFVLPPSIRILKFLKVLDLRGTELTHLPDCVGELTSLEHLSISFYGSMNHSEYKGLPSKLVSDVIIVRLLRLRELGIFVYPGDRRWTLNASNITKEISNLKLFGLHFHFPQVKDLECFVHESQSWKSRSLTIFSIVVGYDFKRLVPLVSNDAEVLFNEGQRRLRFVNGEIITNAVVEVLTRATCFYLDHHLTISNLSQFGVHSFDGLELCILRDCPELIEIVGMEEQEIFLFPVLEYLSINNLWKLERLWVGQIAQGSLARLRNLSVHACPKLRYVFTCSMLDILSNLEELVIEDCASLICMVIGDNVDEKEIMYGDVSFVSNEVGSPVLHNLKVLKLHHLPELCGIWRGQWPLLEYISFYDCPLLKNLHMKVNDDVHIKEIAADKAWWDSLNWNDLELYRRLQKRLTQIDVDDL